MLAFVLALALMLWRGPYRALQNETNAPPATHITDPTLPPGEVRTGGGSSDFSLIWQSTRAFIEGQSPYQLESIAKVWLDHSGSETLPPSERNPALHVYPPSAYVLLSPWAFTDWRTSRILWITTNAGLLIVSTVLVLGLAGLHPRRAAWWFAAAACLALAPGHAAISVGQVSILVLFLILLAQVARVYRRENLAGILLGLACAIKPQIALLFLAYEIGRLRWRIGIMGAITIILCLAAGSAWLARANIDWIPQWRANLEAFANSDNANPTRANPIAFQLINLHYLLHLFSDNVRDVKLTIYAIGGLLCAAYFVVDWRAGRERTDRPSELLAASFVSAIALLVVYHRIYDAVILLIPVAWTAAMFVRRVPAAWISAGLLLAFAGPWSAALHSVIASGRIPVSLASARWFEALVVAHAPVALLALAITYVAARTRRPTP